MRAIYKRELRSYFHSMIGYVFIAFLVAYIRTFLMYCQGFCSYTW